MNILLTGGAGFIGSAVARHLMEHSTCRLLNVDKLTYASNRASLPTSDTSDRYWLKQIDICDRTAILETVAQFEPDAIIHLAAESHVDRSIDAPGSFIQTNVVGTFELLEAARAHYRSLPSRRQSSFRFVHVSTDEVYGDLEQTSAPFDERSRYAPSSPYAASKAAADHLVRAWHRTYDLPVVVTHCSNNYGPFQFPEKLIPHMILNAIQGLSLPVYGDGRQVRDWLYVDDHVSALMAVLHDGIPGETYNVGGFNELPNIDVVRMICDRLEQTSLIAKPAGIGRYEELIEFVEDRPGHDRRYAIDATRIRTELGWVPTHSFDSGLASTIEWYLRNERWWRAVLDGSYRLQRRSGVVE